MPRLDRGILFAATKDDRPIKSGDDDGWDQSDD
jgi:hypothetical protein